jgi:hypothetical protein
MFATRAKKRSGSSARNERVSVWFRGLSVRNIAFGIKQNRSSLGQVKCTCELRLPVWRPRDHLTACRPRHGVGVAQSASPVLC